jgi:glycosyltransferase involved in cell wall biosynthesis
MKGKDIIVVGIQPWDIAIGSNCKNIAEEFAKHNRVLYVNAPLDRATLKYERNTEKTQKRLKILKGELPDIYQIHASLWTLYPRTKIESINLLPGCFIYDLLNKRNSRLFASQIMDAAKRLGFKDFILFNDSLMFMGIHLKELLKPKLYIYYMRDFLTKHPYWKKHGERLEPQLIKTADLVVNNSTLYAEYGARFNKHSYMVGQGCDTSLFNDELRTINVAADLLQIPKPIVGYVGFLSSRRLDIKLLEKIAIELNPWSLVLVGPEDEEFEQSKLHTLPNVYFLGSREPEKLPDYIKGFDVAINPQLINDATMGNYPRKIDEYLALGKPTVGSATKAMEYFNEVAYLASNHSDFVELIKTALKTDSAEKQAQRKSCAFSHSWENNVNTIYAYAKLVANEKNITI